MDERAAPSRAFNAVGGVVAVAGLAVAFTLYGAQFTFTYWTLTGFATIAIACIAANALPIRGLRLRRTGLAAEAIFHDLPISAGLMSIDPKIGPAACALAYAVGFFIATIARSGETIADPPRHGILRTLVCLALLVFGGTLLGNLSAMPAVQQVAATAVVGFVLVLIYNFLISAPVSSLVFHIPLKRVWERMARDRRWWTATALSIFWVVVGRYVIVIDQYWLLVAIWAPVVLVAVLLRTIDKQFAELHRLRLVRDAVQAMLGDRDPLPQINAILAALRVQAVDETVSVIAATTGSVDSWRVVTKLGPTLSSAGDELGRRILARLKFSGSAYTTLSDEYYVVYAFAVQANDGEVHGALTVHRRNNYPLTGEQIAQLANAAGELAPLLRDMRSIAATQSAATIDGLTGLANRAATMDRLAAMLGDSSATENGALLLLDIDHFKSINDQLGHAAGDDCLRRIAEIIRSTVRAGDTAGRIGGEEFLIVMPGASRDVAMTVGERLRHSVALGGMRYGNGDPVTTSIGVAAARIGDTAESILARADRGLYEAKRQGRNRIVEDLESA